MGVNLLKGGVSFIKDFFGLKNQKEYLDSEINLFIIILFAGLMGLIRVTLSVIFKIFVHPDYPKWFSFDPDIIFAMYMYAIYLCLMGAMVIHIVSKLVKSPIEYTKLIRLLMYIQLIHITVPFIDYTGQKLGIPAVIDIISPAYYGTYIASPLFATLGLFTGWVFVFYMFIKVFTKEFKISISKTLTILILSFCIAILPIYFLWPAPNTVFNNLFQLTNAIFASNYLWWGCGVFLVFLSIIAGLYYYFQN